MKNLKKTIAMISSVVMAGSVFAACGGSTETTTDTQAPAAEGETTAAAAEGETEAAAEGETEAAAAEGDSAAADKLTVLCWNTDDIDPMLKLFCEKTGHTADEFNVKSFGCGGGEAA
ncbi:MAG: hypothetical protein SOT68_11505, partial [Oscillospiraceae bacterium]|nr:hypothetical protein [Oscillospiraceae bacterium]MDY2864800.1 hypothetical protein [Oscillospiraceae bacterium]